MTYDKWMDKWPWSWYIRVDSRGSCCQRWSRCLIRSTQVSSISRETLRMMLPTMIMGIHSRKGIWCWYFTGARWATPTIAKTGAIRHTPNRAWRWGVNRSIICHVRALMRRRWNSWMFSKDSMLNQKIAICKSTKKNLL